MSVRAGSIVTIAGRNVVDRLQSAGLGNSQVPIETIREIGNDLVVDKVPGEPDFTFSMESWDVTTDLMAFLHGEIGTATVTEPPGFGDAAGTEYKWEDCEFVNITSPWKGETGADGGDVIGGLLIPGYYPTRCSYRFGVTDNAQMTLELAGGSFYYAEYCPVEETAAGDGIEDTFTTSEAARALRLGGPAGTAFQRIFGVIVNGVLQVKDVDYTETTAAVGAAAGVANIVFEPGHIPANLAQIRFCYFTNVAKSVPQAMNADNTIKPGAVRGRDIVVTLDPDGDNLRLSGVQTVELEASVEGEVQRELGNRDITGRVITGTDVTGTVTIRPKEIAAFYDTLAEVTGRAETEVFDYFNLESAPVEIKILNPNDRAEVLKTIFFEDAQFQPPPTPGRVNAAVDFPFQFNSINGTFSEFKGERP